ncbi:MAG: hypothetical protein K5855_05365 [Oscillospiraceae bacterium]|nr:hypothetical protein [Oscillospiraceae bacterium]
MPLLDIQPTRQKKAAPSARPELFRGRLPTKETINFAVVGVKRTRWWLAMIMLVVIAAAAFAIGKFLVYDRLEQVSEAQRAAAEVRSELNDSRARIAGYGELNDVYAHYTYSGMTEEELALVDRTAVMELLEHIVFPRTDVSEWDLNGNKLSLILAGDTLQEINDMVQALLEEPMVSYCEVNTATSDFAANRTVVYDDGEKVLANAVIYLSDPEEAAEQ